jgi:hypothetical protein
MKATVCSSSSGTAPRLLRKRYGGRHLAKAHNLVPRVRSDYDKSISPQLARPWQQAQRLAQVHCGFRHVTQQLGRPVVKAWNAIGSDSFARKGKPAGSADRIAIPVAADSETERKLGMALVEDTGFDAFDAGPLMESWRQQPGTPCYCTDPSRAEMRAALAAADATRSPKRRDLAAAAVHERFGPRRIPTQTTPSASTVRYTCEPLRH